MSRLDGRMPAGELPSMARRSSSSKPTPGAALLAWYRAAAREMPWRETRDPWAIWVSEIMLQQTRVSVVKERFSAFLRRFPHPAALARAEDDELLSAWKGLGYYRRARLLREGARKVLAEHGGRIPQDPRAFGALPGVGPYTKGAVLSIAFGLALPALDGNVERVGSRFLLLRENPRKKAGKERILAWIAELHRQGPPGEINQALMDLGALVCSPRSPRCGACPWKDRCAARREGLQEELPRIPRGPEMKEVRTQAGLAFRSGLLLARRIPPGEINEGQWGLPGLGLPRPRGKDLAALLEKEHRIRVRPGPVLLLVRHAITRYRVLLEVRPLRPAPPLGSPGEGLAYLDPRDSSLPWTTVTRKVLSRLEKENLRHPLFPAG